MEDEVGVEVEDTTEQTHAEETEQVLDDVKEEVAEEPVDDQGVPLKNRQAEAARKAKKAMTSSQAESSLLEPARQGNQVDQDEAVRIVEGIADQRAKALIAPLIVKQFLIDNPDAKEMIDDINRVRTTHPEIAGIEQLDLAYKIARAERQEEVIRQRVEAERKNDAETLNKANQASAEGGGKARSSAKPDLAAQIANASSMEELAKLEALIK